MLDPELVCTTWARLLLKLVFLTRERYHCKPIFLYSCSVLHRTWNKTKPPTDRVYLGSSHWNKGEKLLLLLLLTHTFHQVQGTLTCWPCHPSTFCCRLVCYLTCSWVPIVMWVVWTMAPFCYHVTICCYKGKTGYVPALRHILAPIAYRACRRIEGFGCNRFCGCEILGDAWH